MSVQWVLFYEQYFKGFIEKTKDVIVSSNMDIEDFCVGGSAPLAAYGLRECRFDVLHLPPTQDINSNEVVSSHNEYIGYYGDALENIIFNPAAHFILMVLKFISPQVYDKDEI